ncbi:hypothetical protein C5167_000094 [Papaver somniferum]|uniref:Uncharacterized protein n=1 Tax=Papaver somniferum TaxID=3469 RepID=A0A4Y7KU86_PAPSO|nr:uncharacterized protein LOC113309088 isoform X2 [Papaver somniferum]RZC75748.1 hypothetical protein C5167_000094 [Papaver somniferum]
MYAVKYTHNYVYRRRDRTKMVLRSVSTDSSTIGMLKFMHNYMYRSHKRTKIVLNRVSGSEATKSISTIAFARKLMQLNKEEQQIRRWDAALQIEHLRAEKLSSKEDNYVDKNLASNNNKVRWTSGKRDFFLDNNYPCLFIYGEMDMDLDYTPIEDEQIITEEGEIKYVVTSEKYLGDRVYLSLHYGSEWKQTHKIVVRAPHWRHMLLINTFTFSNVVKKMYPKNG